MASEEIHQTLLIKINFLVFMVIGNFCVTLCSDSDGSEQHIGIIGKPLSNFDTTSLTELEKEDDEDEEDDDGCVNLETSARSYRTR